MIDDPDWEELAQRVGRGGPLLRRLRQPAAVRDLLRSTVLHRPLRLPNPGSRLYGDRRGTYRPTIALHTLHRMGPVRHALAQRAICGILEVHAPFPEATKP